VSAAIVKLEREEAREGSTAISRRRPGARVRPELVAIHVLRVGIFRDLRI